MVRSGTFYTTSEPSSEKKITILFITGEFNYGKRKKYFFDSILNKSLHKLLNSIPQRKINTFFTWFWTIVYIITENYSGKKNRYFVSTLFWIIVYITNEINSQKER